MFIFISYLFKLIILYNYFYNLKFQRLNLNHLYYPWLDETVAIKAIIFKIDIFIILVYNSQRLLFYLPILSLKLKFLTQRTRRISELVVTDLG
jgi:hypothetical protein